MKFEKLTDEQWEYIRPLLPEQTGRGRRRAEDRMTIDAILYLAQIIVDEVDEANRLHSYMFLSG